MGAGCSSGTGGGGIAIDATDTPGDDVDGAGDLCSRSDSVEVDSLSSAGVSGYWRASGRLSSNDATAGVVAGPGDDGRGIGLTFRLLNTSSRFLVSDHSSVKLH